MRMCPYCQGMLIKYGFLRKEKTQKYRCKKCSKMCSDASKRTFGTLRSKPETISLVITLLTEGVGVRGAARIAKCHRDTVLRILKHAGQRSQGLLEKTLVDLPLKHVQADEIHTFVLKKNHKDLDPELDFNPWGDYYIFTAIDTDSKLMLMPAIGKRSARHTEAFATDMARSVKGEFELVTDGFRGYRDEVLPKLGGRVSFTQFYKEYAMLTAKKRGRLPKNKKSGSYVVRSGNPNRDRITTAHIERSNLSLRHYTKRFTRRGIAFSKDEEYLACAVYLFIAAHNFMKPHGALAKKTTPAMANGLASKPFEPTDLLNFL